MKVKLLVALVLALTALAAPAARADVIDNYLANRAAAERNLMLSDRYFAIPYQAASLTARPDDRALPLRSDGQQPPSVIPYLAQQWGNGTPPPAEPIAATDGYDWTAGGAGAAIAFCGVLLALAGAIGVRRSRKLRF